MTLRSRLLVGLAIVVALLVALALVVVLRQRSTLVGQLDDRLATIAPLAPAPGPRSGPGAPPPNPAPDGQPISDLFIAFVSPQGEIEIGVQGQLLDGLPDLSDYLDGPPQTPEFATVGSADGEGSFRVLAQRARDGATAVAAIPADGVDQAIDRLVVTFVIVGAAIGAVLAVTGWWVWRLGLRPITEMTGTAAAIASGDLGRRIPALAPGTEAGQLGATINSMLDERDRTEERLRRFVSDASHELRTPLTSVRGYVEVYESGGFPEPDQVDDAMRRIGSESNRMDGLVESLLRLARLDEEEPLSVAATDIGELVRDACADAVTARPDTMIGADAPDRGDLIAEVDAGLITQVVAGLINNAAVHAPGASVEVGARSVDGQIEITVGDDGPGMSPEVADRVFDRFYRSDESRSRRSGGSGLGLSIAAAVAARHGGTVSLDTALGQGCVFTLRIPAQHTSA